MRWFPLLLLAACVSLPEDDEQRYAALLALEDYHRLWIGRLRR